VQAKEDYGKMCEKSRFVPACWGDMSSALMGGPTPINPQNAQPIVRNVTARM